MHTLAVTNKGLVFAWGDNTKRQLGLGSSDTIHTYYAKPNVAIFNIDKPNVAIFNIDKCIQFNTFFLLFAYFYSI